jgi:signal transduction histidine kinase
MLVVPLAIAAVTAMVFVSEGAYWRATATLDDQVDMAEARVAIQAVQWSLLDADTAERGFVLTADGEFRCSRARAIQSMEDSFEFLGRYFLDDPDAQPLLERWEELASAGRQPLGLGEPCEPGRVTAAAPVGVGRDDLDAVRALGATLLERETTKMIANRDDVYRTLQLGRSGVVALSVCSVVLLALYVRERQALAVQQKDRQRLAQAENARLETEVLQRTAQLTLLARHLQTAREDERSRLARDLHDELGALLTAAKLDAARIRSRLGTGAPEAMERLTHLTATLDKVAALKRRITEDLHPSALTHLGLVATLEILAREFGEASGVVVHTSLLTVTLGESARLVVYRVAQEAINNVTKHGGAANVWMHLASEGSRVVFSVRDDGRGFDPASTRTSSLGLIGMRFRVEAEGGVLSVASVPGAGTTITVTLPAEPPDVRP